MRNTNLVEDIGVRDQEDAIALAKELTKINNPELQAVSPGEIIEVNDLSQLKEYAPCDPFLSQNTACTFGECRDNKRIEICGRLYFCSGKDLDGTIFLNSTRQEQECLSLIPPQSLEGFTGSTRELGILSYSIKGDNFNVIVSTELGQISIIFHDENQ